MLLRRKWVPLLYTGLFASSFLALYFFKVKNRGSSVFEKMSCKQPSTVSKENGMFDLHFVHYTAWKRRGGRGGGVGLMVSVLDSVAYCPGSSPEALFSEAPETFRARKAMFSSSVSKSREVYTFETSCMKGTSCSCKEYVNKTALQSKGSRFCYGFTGPKSFLGFRETGPRPRTLCCQCSWARHSTLKSAFLQPGG